MDTPCIYCKAVEIGINAKNKERMENRNRIIELLTAVRYTTNDIEKVADEICSLFDVSQQRELLKAFYKSLEDSDYLYPDECDMHVNDFLDSL
jgi:arginine decarboxylase-like protein